MAAELEIERLDARAPDFEARFAKLEQRRSFERADLQDKVAAIIDDVRRRGDAAVLEAIERFDGYRLEPKQLRVTPAEIDAGAARVGVEDTAALALAAERISRVPRAARAPRGWDEAKAGQRLGPPCGRSTPWACTSRAAPRRSRRPRSCSASRRRSRGARARDGEPRPRAPPRCWRRRSSRE
jgi:hypothetical protein